MSYIVGSYAAAAPAEDAVGSHAELVAALADNALVGGLELPFNEGTPLSDQRFRDVCRTDWRYVITAFPETMFKVGADPDFGLASPNEAGRAAGLAHARAMCDEVARIAADFGTAVVDAVQLHSAPSGHADGVAFAASLSEIAQWDWSGARVTIEHCDAHTNRHTPQKGFLTFVAEADAISTLGAGAAPVGITINWARSAIEARSAHAPATQIAAAAERGILAGVMFSGVADVESPYGAPWLDAHLIPAAPDDPDFDLLPGPSLLGPAQITESLRAAGDAAAYLGVKVGLRPASLTTAERVARIEQALALVDRCSATMR